MMPDYDLIERLGEGNFGEVWLAYDQALGVNDAVKLIRRSRIGNPTKFYEEPRTLMALQHDNIVVVKGAGTAKDGRLYIAMEYLSEGSLASKYKGRPVALTAARKYIGEVCWAVEYAHQKGFVHRDIKPANILVCKKGRAKLSDFGLATRAPRGSCASPYGYLTHVAPEVFTSDVTNRLTDIYALGVTAYRLFNGDAFLPVSDTEDELIDMVLAGDYPDRRHYRPYIPTQVRRVINKAMAVTPSVRYQSAASFRLALERTTIRCDWAWRQKKKSVTYRTRIGSAKVTTVVKDRGDGKFDITTAKQVGSAKKRRVGKDCQDRLNISQMKAKLRAILTRYVTQGR